ncbi:MAG: FHA domain-containing protein [Anaerolineae bacterium]|nr:FHA domain-containing protein [Anaerolineae bacterium]MCO5205585.1 FHA domain-containing protein [Anaerolineae bacterium]
MGSNDSVLLLGIGLSALVFGFITMRVFRSQGRTEWHGFMLGFLLGILGLLLAYITQPQANRQQPRERRRSAETHTFHIDVYEPNGRYYRVPVGRSGVWIGREEKCQVHPDDQYLSGYHCWLGLADGQLQIRDNNSRYGIAVNGQRVTNMSLNSGDQIVVGQTRLQIFVG